MPSDIKNIFENESAEQGAVGDFGHAHKEDLNTAFAASPIHGTKVTQIETGNFAEDEDGNRTAVIETLSLDRESYKEFYETYVLGGFKNIPGSFSPGVSTNYSFNGVPTLTTKTVEGEGSIGGDDSTISVTGKGPNVTTMNINSATNPAKGLTCVEPSSQVKDNVKDPLSTTRGIEGGDMYGGSVPGKSLGSRSTT